MTKPLDDVIAAARAAVSYHSAGYATNLPWDADLQLQLMDELGEALERLDEASGIDSREAIETHLAAQPEGPEPGGEAEPPK